MALIRYLIFLCIIQYSLPFMYTYVLQHVPALDSLDVGQLMQLHADNLHDLSNPDLCSRWPPHCTNGHLGWHSETLCSPTTTTLQGHTGDFQECFSN